MKILTNIFVALVLFLSIPVSATIVNTKHNLSAGSSDVNRTIYGTGESEICAFCHIPHHSQVDGKPLWNRSMPTTDYEMYDSDYLRRIGYPEVALDLGTANNTPGALSRQCLSCHDGTVAIGSVHVLRGTFLNPLDPNDYIAMEGVASSDPNPLVVDGGIPSSSAGFIGTDLTMHHPVGIEYDATIDMATSSVPVKFDIGTRTSELKTDPDLPIKLFDYGDGKRYVECSSCHNPHSENNRFLHVDSGNLANDFLSTCISCHDRNGWVGSAHQSPPNPDTKLYTDQTLIDKYGTARMDELGCANCHTPHNAGGVPYLNRHVQEETCFNGASNDGDTATSTCHGIGGAKDIQTVVNKDYAHPVVTADNPGGLHTNLDTLYGTGVTPYGLDGNLTGGIAWDTNKHAVCMDCHNPHKTRAGIHIDDRTTWYGEGILRTQAEALAANQVSNVLNGVSGVEPDWDTDAWKTQTTTFTTMESAEKEYQICMKCHSYWGLGATTTGATGHVSPSGAIMTDLAWDMNKYNKSGHPVVVHALDRTGSYGPKELLPAQLLSPWIDNPGYNTMYCSDCHGADNEDGLDPAALTPADPRGPHGSDLLYILKGENHYWPTRADGVTLYTLDDIVSGDGAAGVICKNCHDIAYPHTNWWNQMKNRNIQCIECHVAVPHGSPASRLIGYDNFPEPYNYGGNSLKISGFRKNGGEAVNNEDVFAPNAAACNNGACHRNDYSTLTGTPEDPDAGKYDNNPYNAIQEFNYGR